MSKIMPHYSVVVVGAGMVGASLACALHDIDIDCLLLEAGTINTQADWLEDDVDPRVSALGLAAQNLLTHLGTWSRIKAMGRWQDYQYMHVWDGWGRGALNFSAAEQHVPHLGHILENKTITTALHQALHQRHAAIWQQVQLQDMSPQDMQPRLLTLTDGRQISTDLVVGADGAHSKVRQLAAVATREWDYPHHALVTRVALSQSHENTAWQRFTEQGILAFLPLRSPLQITAEGHCAIVWSTSPHQVQMLSALSDDVFCSKLQQAFEGRLGAIIGTDQRHVMTLRQCHVKQYVQSGLVLVGDAAHTIHPLAGQGANLGFLDVASLVQTLQEGLQEGAHLGSLLLLKRYQERRQQDNLRIMALIESIVRLFGNKHPIFSILRHQAMHMVQKLAPVKQYLAQEALGVGAHLPPLAQPPATIGTENHCANL